MTFEEFEEYYLKNGRCPNDFGQRKNILNDKQLATRYKKYLKSSANKEYTIDTEWNDLKAQLDLTSCSLMNLLKSEKMYEEISELKSNGKWLLNTIDPAHVFSRSKCPHMKYDVDNVVPLNRFSHSCIDSMRDPINGQPITKEQQKMYWQIIVGPEKYEELERRSLKMVKCDLAKEEILEEN